LSESLPVSFVTYTRGPEQYITSPEYETQFLNWLNRVDSSEGFKREVCSTVGVRCCPSQVHAVVKKEATVLKLVKSEEAVKQ
jgi:hypothetical protein